MSKKELRILLVHDAAGRPSQVPQLLLKTDFAQFEIDQVSATLAFRGSRRNYYNVCVIDAPGKGIWILEESQRVGFDTPIIMLTCDSAGEVLNAMRHGAADCLVADTLTAGALEESICVVIERARHREHKSERARRYSGLVENSGEIMYTHDLQGNSIYLSKGGEQLIGYSREEVCNTNFCKIISPECVDSVWQTIRRMLADRQPSSYQAVMVTKDGQRIPVAVAVHLVYKRGNPVEVQGIVRDLSAQARTASPRSESAQSSRVVLTL
jgi:PAS domain S-box-containing protein